MSKKLQVLGVEDAAVVRQTPFGILSADGDIETVETVSASYEVMRQCGG